MQSETSNYPLWNIISNKLLKSILSVRDFFLLEWVVLINRQTEICQHFIPFLRINLFSLMSPRVMYRFQGNLRNLEFPIFIFCFMSTRPDRYIAQSNRFLFVCVQHKFNFGEKFLTLMSDQIIYHFFLLYTRPMALNSVFLETAISNIPRFLFFFSSTSNNLIFCYNASRLLCQQKTQPNGGKNLHHFRLNIRCQEIKKKIIE